MLNSNTDGIIGALKKNGFFFSKFTLYSNGNWDFDDADWNYKDIPHLKHVHKLIEAHPSYINDDFISSVGVQKIPPFIKIPITLTIYDTSPSELTYYSSLLFWIIVVKTKIVRNSYNNTTVETEYNIGSTKFFQLAVPLIKFLIRRNYKDLMSGDLPMRERRGFLRENGISFIKNKKDGKYTFLETTELSKSKLIYPENVKNKTAIFTVELNELNIDEYIYLGDSITGLILIKYLNKIEIFRRICDHEGAEIKIESYDNQACKMICPWHGKKIPPIAKIENLTLIFKIDNINIEFNNNKFDIKYTHF